MTGRLSTREKVIAELCENMAGEHELIQVWLRTPLISMIPDSEWVEMHTGACTLCGAPARLYAAGWACAAHCPGENPDGVS